MAISHVGAQGAGNQAVTSGTSNTQAFPANVTSGNLISVTAWGFNATTAHPWVAGDCTKSAGTATIGAVSLHIQSNVNAGGDQINVGIWTAIVTGTGSCTMQVANMPAASAISMSVDEFSSTLGWDASRLVSTNNANSTVGSTTADSGTRTSGVAGLFLGGLNQDGPAAGQTITTNNTFTDSFKAPNGAGQLGAGGFRIVAAVTTTSSNYTFTNSGPWIDILALLQETQDVVGKIYYPDEADQEDINVDVSPWEWYADFQLPPNTVMSADDVFPYSFEYDDPDFDEPDGEFYWAQAPPIPDTVLAATLFEYFPDEAEDPREILEEDFGFADFQIPPDDTGETRITFPDQGEEPEDEDFGFVDWQLPPSDTGETVVYYPEAAEEPEDEPNVFDDFQLPADTQMSADIFDYVDQTEEPEDEPFGFEDAPRPPDAAVAQTDLIVCIFDDASEEPDDEDYGFLDFQLPPDFIAPPADLIVCVFDDASEEPEGEDFGFADLQIPADDTGQTTAYWPDESEEPEPEDFGVVDWQTPLDDTGGTVAYWPDEAEEPEPEDYGFSDPGVQDDQLYGAVYYPDEAEEPEDEDFGTQGDFPIGVEVPFTTQDQFYPMLSDDLPEDEEEDFGMFDSQVPEDFIPPIPPPVVIGGGDGAQGGGKRHIHLDDLEIFKRIRRRMEEGWTLDAILADLDEKPALKPAARLPRAALPRMPEVEPRLAEIVRAARDAKGLLAALAAESEARRAAAEEDEDDADMLLLLASLS